MWTKTRFFVEVECGDVVMLGVITRAAKPNALSGSLLFNGYGRRGVAGQLVSIVELSF